MGRTESARGRPAFDLADLTSASARDLRRLWEARRGSPLPPTLSARVMRIALAWDFQAEAGGGEARGTHRQWQAVMQRRAEGAKPAEAVSGLAAPPASAGTRLLKTWAGETVRGDRMGRGCRLERDDLFLALRRCSRDDRNTAERSEVLRASGGSGMIRQRCAIYTRKSTEEGLEQSFNSLDAQREACAAYILSQRHEGWSELSDRYDDGGFSGGSMERPGLQRLLDGRTGRPDRRDRRLQGRPADAGARRTSPRWSRSSMGQGSSFVSVTQAFNTTSSMGGSR